MDNWSSTTKIPQIPIVIDSKTNEYVSIIGMNYLYAQDELAYVRLNNLREKRFRCYRCNHVVILSCRSDPDSLHGHYYFFRHTPDVQCEWRYDSPSKAEIYQGVQEGFRHYELKQLIANTLNQLNGWMVISIDKKFVYSPKTNERTKPDLLTNFGGKEIAIEIQLRGESPLRILKRHEIHKEREAYILWITSNSRGHTRVDEDDSIDFRQVHKDIAYSNRGNRYIFTKELAAESVKRGQFILTAVYEYPEINDKTIKTSWQSINVPVDDLTFDSGSIYFIDSIKAADTLRARLRSEGLLSAKKLLITKRPDSFENFQMLVKPVWPTFDKDEDILRLKSMYDEDFNERQLKLKKSIIRYFQSESWRARMDEKWWNDTAHAVSCHNFGIRSESDLRIIEKLILILGIPLSEHLCVDHKSHVRACHYFFDSKSFIPYRHLCKAAMMESVYGTEILLHPTIKSRIEKELPTVVKSDDLDRFFEWFISAPHLHKTIVSTSQ